MSNHTNNSQTNTVENPTLVAFVAIWNVVLACFTVPGNGFLLLALFRDPLGCFNTPTSFLVKSMTFANLLTGLLVEPLAAVSNFAVLYKARLPSLTKDITKFISIIAPNASFMTVYALSLDSFIAVSRPLKYRILVTKRNVSICMAVIWGYLTVFAALPFMGLKYETHIQIDLYVNTIVTLVLLFASYIGLLKALSTNRTRSMSLHASHKDFNVSSSRDRSLERSRKTLQAVIVLVVILTVTIVPNMISWMLHFHCTSCLGSADFLLTIAVLRYLAYLKFLCDPFVYAWRLPRYRRALKITISCAKSGSIAVESSRNSAPFCERESNLVVNQNMQLESPSVCS